MSQAHTRAEKIVATWPGAHRFLMTSPQRLAAVKEVEAFLLGQVDYFGDAAYRLMELSASLGPDSRGLAIEDF
jgi:hypothetical protein